MARPEWTTDVPEHVVQTAGAKIDAGHAADTVYRELDLHRYCAQSTFRAWAKRRIKIRQQHDARRRLQTAVAAETGVTTEEHADPQSGVGMAPSSSSLCLPDSQAEMAKALMIECLGSIAEARAAGTLKPNQAISAIFALNGLVELFELKAPKGEREAETHEAKMELLDAKRRELRQAIDAKSAGGTKAMTREDVYDLVDSIMRGTRNG